MEVNLISFFYSFLQLPCHGCGRVTDLQLALKYNVVQKNLRAYKQTLHTQSGT